MYLDAYYSHFNPTTQILIALTIILFSGFAVTRITKPLGLPNVSAYIFAGILIGPHVLHAIPASLISNMGFVSDLALALIAFGVGKFFKKEVIRETGPQVLIITFMEAVLAGLLIVLFMRFVLGQGWAISMLLGAIATATAPASTMMTINQYHARGEFVNTLLQVVALDDIVCLVIFSAVMAFINSSKSPSLLSVSLPILFNLAALAVGFACGYFLSKLLTPTRSTDNRLILALAMMLGISGVCATKNVSPLLACMVFGATYINLTQDKEIFRQINTFSPPIMSLFFIVSGMTLDLQVLGKVGIVGVSYFFIRIIGKYLGAYLGALMVGSSKPIRDYLGMALVPQAGVAIGLAFLGQRVLEPEKGNLLLTIILSSSVLYEIAGPACAKIALFKSGTIKPHTQPGTEELKLQEGKITADESKLWQKESGLPEFK